MALAVTWVKPVDGEQIAQDQPYVFESYVAYTMQPLSSGYRYRVFGSGGAWTTIPAGNGQTTIPAGTFSVTNALYEVERFLVQASDSGSSTIIIDTGPSSATPSISAPSGSVTNPTATVTWATTPTTQQYAQVQVLNGAFVEWDSGQLAQTAQTLAGVPFPTTGVSRTVRVRIKRAKAYAWSQWASVTVTVTHTPPAAPTIADFNPVDPGGVGYPTMLLAQVTQPTPGGGAPAVVTTEFYVRRAGSNADGSLVGVLNEPGGASWFHYTSPTHGVLYEIQARNVAADGRWATSPWKQANNIIVVKGALLSTAAAIDSQLNRLANPSFEVDTTNWNTANGTISRVADTGGGHGGFAGNYAVTTTPASQWVWNGGQVPVRRDRLYVMAAMLKMLTTVTNMRTNLFWYEKGIQTTITQATVLAAALSSTVFRRVEVVGRPPVGVDNTLAVWTTIDSTPVASGFRLDAASLYELPLTGMFLYNGDEAVDDYQPESSLIQYDGREFPVAEFGTSSSRTIKLSLKLKLDAERELLRTLALSRGPVLYRDRRGRKVYGMLQLDGIQDTFYGSAVDLTITALDYPADRSI